MKNKAKQREPGEHLWSWRRWEWRRPAGEPGAGGRGGGGPGETAQAQAPAQAHILALAELGWGWGAAGARARHVTARVRGRSRSSLGPMSGITDSGQRGSGAGGVAGEAPEHSLESGHYSFG